LNIKNEKIEKYRLSLREYSRPPNKGGNTNALHSHKITILSETYGFFAQGSQQWIYKTDFVSFEYEIKNGYKNINKDTLVTLDKNGKKIIRGNRSYKAKLRTVNSR